MARPPDLYRVSEAAAIAHIHIRTLRRWIARGWVSTWGRPGTLRVPLSEVIPCNTPVLPDDPPR
jgi:hypothetical protein